MIVARRRWNCRLSSITTRDSLVRHTLLLIRLKQRKLLSYLIITRNRIQLTTTVFVIVVMFMSRVCHGSCRDVFRMPAIGLDLYVSVFRGTIENSLPQRRSYFPYHYQQCRDQELHPKLSYLVLSQRFSRSAAMSLTAFATPPLLQHSWFHSKTATRRATTRQKWRAPMLRSNNKDSDDNTPKRPPRLYKRTHLQAKNILDDQIEKLYRADRVLANRTGKSRKDCFQLLQDRRVFRVTDQLYHIDQEQLQGTDKDSGMHTTQEIPISSHRGADTAADTLNTTTTSRIQQYRLEVIAGPSVKLAMSTPLRIDKYQEVPLPPPLLMIYHKPKWVLSVRRDPAGRPCLDNVWLGHNPDTKNPNAVPPLHPVGRLDYDTTGLLLFSSSGPLTQALLHPKHEIEKEYVAVVTGVVHEDELRALLAAGVTTGEGVHTAHLVSAFPNTPSDNDVATYLEKIKAGLPPEYNTTDLKARGYLNVFDATTLSTVTLVVSEGKHRMVRRILANVGHPVVSLHRERLGGVLLGNVPVGQTRLLTPVELKWARKQLKQGSKPLHPVESTSKDKSHESLEDMMD